MTTLREAAQQALEQLKINRTNFRKGPSKSICKMLAGGNNEAIESLEVALAEQDVPEADCGNIEPVQEPDPGEYHGWVLREVLFDNGEPVGHREPGQEPVAWLYEDTLPKEYPYDAMWPHSAIRDGVRMFPLYTAPPQRKPLTDEEAEKIIRIYDGGNSEVRNAMRGLKRALEAAHGIKGEA